MSVFSSALQRVESRTIESVRGTVALAVGLAIEADGFAAPLGAMATIKARHNGPVDAEVVGFRGRRTLLMPLGNARGIAGGDPVELKHARASVPAGESLLGRVVDALGNPMDGLPRPSNTVMRDVFADPPDAMSRPPIHERISTGVRAIDSMFTCGRGQRVGGAGWAGPRSPRTAAPRPRHRTPRRRRPSRSFGGDAGSGQRERRRGRRDLFR
jgi:flagellum-specific ATP synthase